MKGLKSFSLSTDFFASAEMQSISSEFGSRGELVVLRILALVFANGYYMHENVVVASLVSQTNFKESFIREVIMGLISCGFFNKEVANSFQVLTSEFIQREYFKQARKNFRAFEKEYPYLIGEENKKLYNSLPLSRKNANGNADGKEKEKTKEKESFPYNPFKEKENKKEKEKFSLPTHTHVRGELSTLEAEKTFEGTQVKKENLTKERKDFLPSGRKATTWEDVQRLEAKLNEFRQDLEADEVTLFNWRKDLHLALDTDLTPYLDAFHSELVCLPMEETENKDYWDYHRHFKNWLKRKVKEEAREKKYNKKPNKAPKYVSGLWADLEKM